MASFDEHISKVSHNLNVLKNLNKISNTADWQVTICYYSAVHLIDGFLAKEGDLHFMKHIDVDDAINPNNQLSLFRLNEDVYKSYEKLSNLSRLSRYLCSEDILNRKKFPNQSFSTNEKHLKKAINCLDKLLVYFSSKYNIQFDEINLFCSEFSMNTKLGFFKINSQITA